MKNMILDKFNLKGKTALITGCSRGIGKAIALGLAEAGADIICLYRKKTKSKMFNAQINSLNKKLFSYQADLSNRDEIYEFIKLLMENDVKIDILVNNGGIIRRKNTIDYSDDDWDEVMEVNLNSQFIITREIGKQMLKRKNGKIIFIASVLSFQGGKKVPAYAASKGGIVQLVKSLSNEWARKGINVNAIAPGYIKTRLTKDLQMDKERNNAILNRIPAGRWGKPEDIVGAAVFLSSAAANYVNGAVIAVDGGWLGN